MPEIKSGAQFAFYISRSIANKQYELANAITNNIKDEIEREDVEVPDPMVTTDGATLITIVDSKKASDVQDVVQSKLKEFGSKFGQPGHTIQSAINAIK